MTIGIRRITFEFFRHHFPNLESMVSSGSRVKNVAIELTINFSRIKVHNVTANFYAKEAYNVNIIAFFARPSRRPQHVSCIHIVHSAILKLHAANHPASPTIRLCFLHEEMQTVRTANKKKIRTTRKSRTRLAGVSSNWKRPITLLL